MTASVTAPAPTEVAARNGRNGRPDAPGDRTTGQLDVLFADLTTYRYVQQIDVTPALAKRLVDLNDANQRNRKEKKEVVYARVMKRGKWREKTGQVLNISTDGTLLNGQTRLWAVIRSGVTIKFDLCFGIDRGDIIVIDAGTARSKMDVLRAAGAEDLSGASAIVNHVLAWEAGSYMGPSGSTQASPDELSDRYKADADLFEAAAKRGKDCSNRQVGTASATGIGYFLLARHAEDKPYVDDFFDQLVSGIFTAREPARSAPYRLRERLIRHRVEKLSRPEMLALIIRAWNRHNRFDADGNREPVDRLQITRRAPGTDQERLSNANFPMPVRANTKGVAAAGGDDE